MKNAQRTASPGWSYLAGSRAIIPGPNPATPEQEHGMAVTIREVTEHDLDRVLALNNAAGPGILPVDLTRIRTLSDNAAYFRVAEIDGVLGGFSSR
jgi:hypothetical protein